MKRFRLTKVSKILILIMVIAAMFGIGFFAVKKGFVKTKNDPVKVETVDKTDKDNKTEKPVNKPIKETEEIKKENNTVINLSLDEWIGWKSLIDAKELGYYDEEGIEVNIHVVNDATQSSNALIKGDLNAAGYTINRLAFLSNKFTEADVEVVMPFITNYSNGGDGIIATTDIQNVNDFVGARIGVPMFSEAQTMVVWFVNQSDLTQEEKDEIIDNLILFETADETAKAFFAGQIDVAATWQPYLTQAEESTNSHVLFSTASSTSLVMDGIVFRKDFAENNPEVVQKFIRATLKAAEVYNKEFNPIREIMPMFSTESDESIKAMTMDARLATWDNNIEILNGTAVSIYNDMCDVWESIGETVNRDMVYTVFDDSFVDVLSDDFESIIEETKEAVKVTDDNKDDIINAEALLTKSATVNFIINTAKFTDTAEASAVLDNFIKIAKQLDGTIIQIEGNTDPNPASDPTDEYNKLLSQQRAEAVKKYFVLNGIDASRIITVGNGSSNPVVDNDTDEHKAMNRRTDVFFKIIEN